MEFMPHGEVSTDGWTAKVHQYPFPDHSSAPGTFLTRGRKWPQNPADRPWFDQAGASERVEDLRTLLKEGDILDTMIINVDRKSRSINLSIKAKDQAEQNEAMQKLQSESSASSGTTNLGALLKAKLGNTQQ